MPCLFAFAAVEERERERHVRGGMPAPRERVAGDPLGLSCIACARSAS
jgi:hypothetical protein